MTMYQYVVINGANYVHTLDMPSGVYKGSMVYFGNGVGAAYYIDGREFKGNVVNVGSSDVMRRAYGDIYPIVRQDGSRNNQFDYSPKYNSAVGVTTVFDNRRIDQFNRYYDDDVPVQWVDDGQSSATQEPIHSTNVYRDLLGRILGDGKTRGLGAIALAILAYLFGNGSISIADILSILGM